MGFLGGTEGVPNPGDVRAQAAGTDREPVVPAYLAWGDPIEAPQNQLGQLHFDVVITEDHERTAEVTDHSVEQGVAIVDHVRPLPDRVTLEVFVSNTPISSPDAQLAPLVLDIPQPGQGGFLAGGTSQILADAASFIGLTKSYPTQLTAMVQQFSADTDYVQNTYNTLTQLRDTATLLTIATPRQTYTNMIVERIAMHRDASTGTSATFELEFRQIRIVSSSIVDAPLPSIGRATPMANLGKKDPTPAPAPKQSVSVKTAALSGLTLPPPAAGFPAP
jgi:hypothetical protein